MRCRLAALVVLAACNRDAPKQPGPGSGGSAIDVVEPDLVAWSDAWVNREAKRFAEDLAYRRASLEESLVNHANTYSQQRLDSYGLGDRGWDVLPVWNPRSLPVTKQLADTLQRGEMPALAADHKPLWDGKTPTTMAGWVALGRRVFFEFPMRAEVFMEYALTKPELVERVGVERTADGGVPGLVVFANVDGQTRVGITCAICHTAVRHGELVVGAARRRFDYGRLRNTFFEETHSFVEPELARRMARWGPGRADVTEDNDEDPVAIPDLFGLRHEFVLTQAGTINQTSPLALAIRQDTQLTHANHQRIRPPRELAWALAMFLYSLEQPSEAPRGTWGQIARGAGVFAAAGCRGCHNNPAYAGRALPANRIGTDPALANGQARGTGTYRVAPLLDVVHAGPYLHHGAVRSLDELLSPARFAPEFRGLLGSGAIPGHAFGTELAADDRAALIAFLEIL